MDCNFIDFFSESALRFIFLLFSYFQSYFFFFSLLFPSFCLVCVYFCPLWFLNCNLDYSWIFSLFSNVNIECYQFPSQCCFSYTSQIMTWYFHFLSACAFPLSLPRWPVDYLKVSCLVSKCSEMFLVAFCFRFVVGFDRGQWTHYDSILLDLLRGILWPRI